MKAYVVARGAGHQIEWGTAFSAGLRRHGWQVEICEAYPASTGRKEYDLLVLWGVRRTDAIARQLADGGEVCILERGYLGDRFHWTSVSFGGGLNGRAEFRGVKSDPSRFEQFRHLMQPWRKRDGYALLIGQVPGDMSLASAGGDLGEWYRRAAAELKEKGYDVRFRQHPMAIRRGLDAKTDVRTIEGALQDAFDGAAAVVTFNSNTGVESVLAGVPTMSADIGSMAWPVTAHEVGQIVTPDREEWAAELAWKQWTLEEMASGVCWEVVGGGTREQRDGPRAA